MQDKNEENMKIRKNNRVSKKKVEISMKIVAYFFSVGYNKRQYLF